MLSNVIAKSAFNVTNSILDLIRIFLDIIVYFSMGKQTDGNNRFVENIILSSNFKDTFNGILIISGAVFLLTTIIMLIKTLGNKETHIKGKIVIDNAVKALIIFFLLPIILLLVFSIMNFVGGQLVLVSNFKADQKITSTIISIGITEDCWIGDAESSKMYSIDKNERILADKSRKSFFNMIDKGSSNYDDIKDSGLVDFNKMDVSLMLFLSITLLISIGYLLVEFVRYGIKVVYLYLISPLIIAVMTIDNGNGLKDWFKSFLEVFLSGYIMLFLLDVFLLIYGFTERLVVFNDIRKNRIIFSILYACLIMSVPLATKEICRFLNIGDGVNKKSKFKISSPKIIFFKNKDKEKNILNKDNFAKVNGGKNQITNKLQNNRLRRTLKRK